MDTYKVIINEKIARLRQQYNLGNYCGRSIFNVIEKLNIDGTNPLLFRLPFKNDELSGFVGFKHNRFVVFTNTNRNLGYEVFTAAHEIFHLLENVIVIKEKTVIEEAETPRTEVHETLADLFAAELLMPEVDISEEYARLAKGDYRDEALIIHLQQQYFVEYKAVTKRLKELTIIDSKIEETLNEILDKGNELEKLTKKLGYSNELNEPTRDISLPKDLLNATRANYENKDTTYNDLYVLFSYCNLSPEKFGYEEPELSQNANALMEKVLLELENEGDGEK